MTFARVPGLLPTGDSAESEQRVTQHRCGDADHRSGHGVDSIVVTSVHGSGRHERCVNKYSAMKPGPGTKYTLQREPRGHGAGNVSARKNARMDSVPSEDPQIESPYDRCNSGRI